MQQKAKLQNLLQLKIITGKGTHSSTSGPRLKPAILDLVTKLGLTARFHVRNDGVLVVDLLSGGGAKL